MADPSSPPPRAPRLGRTPSLHLGLALSATRLTSHSSRPPPLKNPRPSPWPPVGSTSVLPSGATDRAPLLLRRATSPQPPSLLTSLSDPIRPMDPTRHLVRPTSAPSPPPLGHTSASGFRRARHPARNPSCRELPWPPHFGSGSDRPCATRSDRPVAAPLLASADATTPSATALSSPFSSQPPNPNSNGSDPTRFRSGPEPTLFLSTSLSHPTPKPDPTRLTHLTQTKSNPFNPFDPKRV